MRNIGLVAAALAVAAVVGIGCGGRAAKGGGGNPSVATFVDSRDSAVYRKVKIGALTWMVDNLNYDVPNTTMDVCYENRPDNCLRYGRLYDWETAMKACPAGWRLPSGEEWTALIEYAGGDSAAGVKLKSKTGWSGDGDADTTDATDEYGFSALPGGHGFYTSGNYHEAGVNGYWWSATENGNIHAKCWYIDQKSAGNNEYYKTLLYSVRCVED